MSLITAQTELREQIQVVNLRNDGLSKEKHLSDQLEHDAGKSITAAGGGKKMACSDVSENCQPQEPAALYSEIALTSKLREHTTPVGEDGKTENVYSEPGSKEPPTKSQEASVPLKENLCDQPVSL